MVKKIIGTIMCQDSDADMIHNLLRVCLEFIQTVMRHTIGIEIDMREKELEAIP